MKSRILLLLLVFGIGNLQAQTIGDIIRQSDDHTVLELALDTTGLFSALDNVDDTLTVFAPTDAAFGSLDPAVITQLLADPSGQLTQILLYHVAAGEVSSGDVGVELIFPTLQGTTAAAFTDGDGNVFIDGVQVTMANIEADNGIVHVLDAAPLNPNNRFVTDIVMESPAHNTLEVAFSVLGINGAFSSPDQDLTLFAPTDSAFALLGPDVVSALVNDPAALNAVLANHVAIPAQSESELDSAQTIRAINNRKLNITTDANGNLTVNGAVISMSDIVTDNGIVHVVEAVVPEAPFTVLDVVELNNQVFNTLGIAIDTAGIASVLDDPDATLTVFAPTDQAFSEVNQDSLAQYLGDPMGRLTEILTYHVSGTALVADSISNGRKISTVQGQDLNVTVTANQALVENAAIVQVDVLTDNGVVHVIDRVLDPQRLTVNEIIEGSEVHDVLEVAVGAAGLNGVLSTDGPFTVLAPTDEAFDALPDGTLQALLDDPANALTPVLLYHTIVGEEVRSEDLSKGQSIETANGTAYVELTEDNRVFIDNAEVTVTDLQGANGVVHVLDAVLLPQRETVVDVVVNSADHTTLTTAVTLAQLAGTLSGDGPFTLFAPDDDAFAALDPATLQAALDDPQGLLTTVLTYHVVAGAVTSDMLQTGMVPTLQGEMLEVVVDNGAVTVNGATVTDADIEVDNGVVHVVDGVLLPPSITSIAEVAYELVSVFPNPAVEEITVNAENLQDARYSVIDKEGRIVKSGVLNAQQKIVVEELPTGTYTLAINTDKDNLMAPFIKIQ